MTPVYLDYNATTPVDPDVAGFMTPLLHSVFGNPSSAHTFGTEARKVIETARKSLATLLGCHAHEIIFTSGGTESNNLAIRGIARARSGRGRHIITTAIEHPAVLEVCRQLEEEGYSVSYLPVNRDGLIDLRDLEQVIRPDTILVSIMHANNETGTIQPVAEAAEILKQRDIVFHTDAAQSVGKIPVKVNDLGIDLLSIAGHKFYAPKGVGALYIREGTEIVSLMKGASHERNLRPGTENVLEIAGLGKAAEIAGRDLTRNAAHMKKMTDLMLELLHEGIPGIIRNGHPELCLPNTLNLTLPNIDTSVLLPALEKVAISAGAACHAEDVQVSHVLKAMGRTVSEALGSVRISVGKNSTGEEIRAAAAEMIRQVRLLRGEGRSGAISSDTSGIRLTHYTHGMGCACKISPAVLNEVLKDFPVPVHPDILVGIEGSDDAAVYRISNDLALVQTVDFFTPVVDNPRHFGAIAAANALSDIYAMGARPLFALNIVAFPNHRLPLEVLREILEGASEKAREAGIYVLGGHTIEDNEPKFGMVVSGLVHPDRVWRNNTARPGDMLILTKPIGTGILGTALKKGMCSPEQEELLTGSMIGLNKTAMEVLLDFEVSACTDVTGFGLLGHLKEMLGEGSLSVNIHSKRIPLLEGVYELATQGLVPGGTQNNKAYTRQFTSWDKSVSETLKIILCDAQTSGGLLAAIAAPDAGNALQKLKEKGLEAAIIGEFTSPVDHKINVF